MKELIKVVILASFLIVPLKGQEYWKTEKYTSVIEGLKNIGLSDSEIDSLFSSPNLEFYPEIIGKFDREKKADQREDINIYTRFLKEESIELGRNFLEDNRKLLESVEEETGIGKEYIVALFRVESAFGQYLKYIDPEGEDYNAFSSLNSVILYGGEKDSSRISWAREWLVNLIPLYERELKHLGMSIFNIPSSRAGCLGLPQFSPSRYMEYAVDADGDGIKDAFYSIEDAAWSSAYCLEGMGFKNNKRKALLRWNRSGDFADFVLNYAEKLKESVS